MKNIHIFMIIVCISTYVLGHAPSRDRQETLLRIMSSISLTITPEEITKTSRAYRYENNYSLLSTLNLEVEAFDLNNMERLEYLKYLLDAGYVPLPPYIDFTDYFENDPQVRQPFPRIEDIVIKLHDVCRLRPWSCDSSPVSFMRLGLLTTPFLWKSGVTEIRPADLEILFATFGYTWDDFTPNDFKILRQFLTDLGYTPLWPDEPERPHIKDVTDDDFQEEVIDASRSGQKIIVYFHASWCPPCHRMTPILEDLATEFEGAFTLAKIYLDGNPEARQILSQSTIPALLFYHRGEVIAEGFGLPWGPSIFEWIPFLDSTQEALRKRIENYIQGPWNALQ